MGEADLGLRERKKQRTREQIVESAMALFDERGFEQVTIADIAASADIAPRTFFSYFPSKEDVVFHDFQAHFGAMQAQMDGRAPDESTLDVLRAFVERIVEQIERDSPRARVVAAAAAAALMELEHAFDKMNMPENPMAAFDEVFAFVRGGLQALQGRPPAT
jgi:AcrR family transcriptional regulator